MAYDTNGWNGGNGPILFTNVRVLDATGEFPYTGEVHIQDRQVDDLSPSRLERTGQPVTGANDHALLINKHILD